MKRVFYSFHYDNDCWRVSQIKQIGSIEGQKVVSANEWESVKRGGDGAIKRWVDNAMIGRSTLVVLVVEHTANRKWINYEISKAWNDGKGVLGIYIHNLKNQNGLKSRIGDNPFNYLTFEDGRKLSSLVPCFDPSSFDAYGDIRRQLDCWIEKAARRS